MKLLIMVVHGRRNPDHIIQRSAEPGGESHAMCSCGKRWNFTKETR